MLAIDGQADSCFPEAGSEVLTFVWTMCQWGSLLAAAVLYFVIDSEGPRREGGRVGMSGRQRGRGWVAMDRVGCYEMSKLPGMALLDCESNAFLSATTADQRQGALSLCLKACDVSEYSMGCVAMDS